MGTLICKFYIDDDFSQKFHFIFFFFLICKFFLKGAHLRYLGELLEVRRRNIGIAKTSKKKDLFCTKFQISTDEQLVKTR